MNPADLSAWGTAHKKQLLAGGAGVAVAFGLYKRAHPSTPAAAPATTTAASTAPQPNYSGTGYDSSSSDVYNAIQPQLEQTQNLLQKLLDNLKPSPPPPAVVGARADGFYSNGHAIYQKNSAGLHMVSAAVYAALGKPLPTTLAGNDPLWSLPIGAPSYVPVGPPAAHTAPPPRVTPPKAHAPVVALPRYPGYLSSQGSSGSVTRAIQSKLNISSDGIYGPQTAGAVKTFQGSHGLSVDGVVGPQTWAAMFR